MTARPDIFARFAPLQQQHEQIIRAVGSDPLGVRIDRVISPTEAEIEGRRCIMLGTNNYLGLTFDEQALRDAKQALDEAGTGTTGSRVANGNYGNHQNFERALAEYFGRKHAILFTTGYQANVGFLSAICGKDDFILIDADSHASIYDGCKMSPATVLHFRHNDPEDLARRLKRLPEDAVKLVVVEGIYSMLGDTAPLKEIAAVTKRHGAYLAVDEAHSLGVLGDTSRGLAEREGIEGDVDFILGTLSKSLGTIGGFCVSNHDGIEAMRVTARAYLFTASLPPSVVASAHACLRRMQSDPLLKTRLWRNTDLLYDGLKEMGYRLGPEKMPVIGVQMGGPEAALAVWRGLLDRGVYVNLALPPATPNNSCLLRCSVSASHDEDQMRAVLAAFADVLPAESRSRAAG